MSKFSNISLKVLTLSTALLMVLGCASEPVKTDDPAGFHVNKQENSIKKVDGDSTSSTSNSNRTKKKRSVLFDWPVWEARMSRGFMPKVKRKGRRASRPHKGIDLAAPRGVPVMASTDGLVIYTGKDFNGFGKMIMIETVGDNAGYATLYAHLDKIVVYDGQKVIQGEVIGALGNTGRSSGPHLHFEIRRSDGIPIDPLPMLPAGKDLTNDVDDPSAPEE
jgi:murein DD-endopeptidase MepM/ murein hydrolase activator NlpD